eukprot:2776324-Pleurochrysis_carterae.AAC.1
MLTEQWKRQKLSHQLRYDQMCLNLRRIFHRIHHSVSRNLPPERRTDFRANVVDDLVASNRTCNKKEISKQAVIQRFTDAREALTVINSFLSTRRLASIRTYVAHRVTDLPRSQLVICARSSGWPSNTMCT